MPTLNEKVCELEKTLLAVDAICSIAEEHAPQTHDTLGHCACVAAHLMEQAMLQIEALRTAIEASTVAPAVVREAA